jgi:hypothetical protein
MISCHCEALFLCRSNLLFAGVGIASPSARNDTDTNIVELRAMRENNEKH